MIAGNRADDGEHDERGPEPERDGLPLERRDAASTKREAAGDAEQHDGRNGKRGSCNESRGVREPPRDRRTIDRCHG